ncbi:MAG: ABATE domain-containing protein [Thermoanaerobaculia bacterium]
MPREFPPSSPELAPPADPPGVGAFEFSGGALCLDFVNSWGDRARPESDQLKGFTALQGFASQAGLATLPVALSETPAAFATALRLRESLYRIFSSRARGRAASPDDVATLNEVLQEGHAHLRIAASTGGEKKDPGTGTASAAEVPADFPAEVLEVLPAEVPAGFPAARVQAAMLPAKVPADFRWEFAPVPLPTAALWPIARSAADLMTSSEFGRVAQCDGSACTWLFLDQSRTRNRRWCSMQSCGNRAKARRHYHRQKQV